MDVDLPAGKYVVAVSGGVDSVVLLHLLAQKGQIAGSGGQSNAPFSADNSNLIVAHFDHGIRSDSAEDRKLVQTLAETYGLRFEYAEGNLGPNASEAVARTARYQFLQSVRQRTGAGAIVTAHHQDDVLETTILNLLRGTDHRGLHSLKSTDVIKRPLLGVAKADIRAYALEHSLLWREDSTNADEKYLRNYIRAHILLRFDEQSRQALHTIIQNAAATTNRIDNEITQYLGHQPASEVLDRYQFIMLQHSVAREVMAVWLQKQAGTELSRRLLERLVVAAKTGENGSKVNIRDGWWLYISATALALRATER